MLNTRHSGYFSPFSYLEYNLFHLLIGRLELSDKDQHHLSGVVVCVLGIHQWDQVTDGFEESSQTLSTKGKKYIVNTNLAQRWRLLEINNNCLRLPAEY